MAHYQIRMHVTDSANPGAHTYVQVPVEKGRHLTDDEIKQRALARAVELFGPEASQWKMTHAERRTR